MTRASRDPQGLSAEGLRLLAHRLHAFLGAWAGLAKLDDTTVRVQTGGSRKGNPVCAATSVEGTVPSRSAIRGFVARAHLPLLLSRGAIRHELVQLLGVPVDVVTPKALPSWFRDEVIAEAVPV